MWALTYTLFYVYTLYLQNTYENALWVYKRSITSTRFYSCDINSMPPDLNLYIYAPLCTFTQNLLLE